jgi:hypothetical protein
MMDRSPLYPCNPSEHRRKLPSQVWLRAARRQMEALPGRKRRARPGDVSKTMRQCGAQAARLTRASVLRHADSCSNTRHQPDASSLRRLVILTLQLLDVPRGVRITGRDPCQLLGVFKCRG